MYNTNLKLIKSILLIMMAGWNLYAQGGKLSGFITDQETGEALIGANVFLIETGNGMSTDKNGYYVLQNIRPGSYTLMVSYIGYATLQKKITFGADESIKMNLELGIEAVEITEVDVSAEKRQRKNNIQPSRIKL